MKQITVFTPTYNRAYTLNKCYESLKRQTSKKFKWLIIDDGSIDNTKQLINSWIKENKIDIKYIYQENQGMHGAHNTAYKNIDTELNICIDSDDYLTDNAIEIILKKWNSCDKKNTAGIIALDSYENGNIIGTKLPIDKSTEKIFDLYYKLGVKGDKKLIYRTDLTKMFPYKVFKDEKLVSLACKYYKIDELYKLNILNETVCIVEYMADGSSRNIKNIYYKNPNGNIEFAKVMLSKKDLPIKNKIKQAIHFVANSIVVKNKNIIIKGRGKVYTIVVLPIGYIYSIIINKKRKKELNK